MNNRKYFLTWFIFSLLVVAGCQGSIRNLPEGVSFFRTEIALAELEWLPNNLQIVGTSPALPLSGINVGRSPSEVYVWDSTSNNLNQISDEAFSYWSGHPVWHPNLDLVMYFSIDEFGEDYKLGAIDSSGNIIIKLDGKNADWIPNKNEILVNRISHLSLFDTETQTYQTVWRTEKGWGISEVAVSPSGQEVAILISDGSPVTHVLVMNLSQGEAQKIYESQMNISQISWGGSGNELLFLTSGTFNELWAISVDGQCITKPFVFGYEFEDVTWSPDGEVIAASTNDEVTGIFLLNTNSDLIQDWLTARSCQL
ncbi:TolB family protein [Candidatus Leptofilum sp.]|uniref:TolB family protein n=1 Tax=Candidatus Leptofilum sp. TaxID=3241576 RepID=UPI003B5B85EB